MAANDKAEHPDHPQRRYGVFRYRLLRRRDPDAKSRSSGGQRPALLAILQHRPLQPVARFAVDRLASAPDRHRHPHLQQRTGRICRQSEQELRHHRRGAQAEEVQNLSQRQVAHREQPDQPTDAWPMQRGFDHFFGTIIGAGSFYNPNTLTRGNDNIEHEAENDPSFFYTDAISDQAAAYIRQHKRSMATRRSSNMSPTPRRIGRCMPMTRTSPNTKGASTPAGTSCGSSGCSGWSTTASSIRTGS